MVCQHDISHWGVTEERVREAVRRIVETTHPLQIIAFGSRARGDHRPDSDLDLAVILDSQEEEVSPSGAYEATGEILMPLDIIVASRTKFDLYRPWVNSVFNYIDEEGILLYDRDHPESVRAEALYARCGGRVGAAVSAA